VKHLRDRVVGAFQPFIAVRGVVTSPHKQRIEGSVSLTKAVYLQERGALASQRTSYLPATPALARVAKTLKNGVVACEGILVSSESYQSCSLTFKRRHGAPAWLIVSQCTVTGDHRIKAT
jgi:hypothetical protein